MAVSFQLVIDCADPEPLARFWAAALGYELEPPPDGFASWDAYWRDVGVPEDELGTGADCIVDPGGRGPRIWFQVVPERKAAKNRLHLDIGVGGGRAVPIETRRQRVDAEAGRLAGLGAELAGVLNTEGLDHYAVAMKDPEGNEFDINCAAERSGPASPAAPARTGVARQVPASASSAMTAAWHGSGAHQQPSLLPRRSGSSASRSARPSRYSR